MKSKNSLIDILQGINFCNTSIAVFSTQINGVLFGLMDASDLMRDAAELVPLELFESPWNGDGRIRALLV